MNSTPIGDHECNLPWVATDSGTTASIPCQQCPGTTTTTGIITRQCTSEMVWLDIDADQCLTNQLLLTASSQVQELDSSNITIEAVAGLLDSISTVIANSSGSSAQDYTSAIHTVRVLTEKVREAVTQNPSIITTNLTQDILKTVSYTTDVTALQKVNQDNNDDLRETVGDIIGTIEDLSAVLAHALDNSNQSHIVITEGNIKLEVRTLNPVGSDLFSTDSSSLEVNSNQFSNGTFSFTDGNNSALANFSSCNTAGVSVEISNISDFISADKEFESWLCVDDQIENTPVASNAPYFSFSLSSVLCDINSTTNSNRYTLYLKKLNPDLIDPQCVTLAPDNGALTADHENCDLVESNATHIQCSCKHLTSFAILMSPDPYYQSNNEMGIFTYVGLSLSIISLIVSLIIYLVIKFKVTLAIKFVHINLIVSILLSELVFLVGINRSEIPTLCLAIACLLHYILLVSFFWMLFEMVNLLILLIRPRINQKILIHLYWPVAYGVPIIVVLATFFASKCDYGHFPDYDGAPSTTNCWLPRRNYRYFGFIGPALLIIAVNFILLIVLIARLIYIRYNRRGYRASDIKKSTKDSFVEGFVSAIRATLLLFPVVGLTWIFGIFALNKIDESGITSLIAQWLFLIFNCLQGVLIFVIFVILKTEVREATLLAIEQKLFRRRVMKSSLSISLLKSKVNSSSMKRLHLTKNSDNLTLTRSNIHSNTAITTSFQLCSTSSSSFSTDNRKYSNDNRKYSAENRKYSAENYNYSNDSKDNNVLNNKAFESDYKA